MVTPAELVAIGSVLTQHVASRPVGGAEYVRLSDYQKLLSAARTLYSEATKPPPPPVIAPVPQVKAKP